MFKLDHFFESEVVCDDEQEKYYSKYNVKAETDIDIMVIDIAKFQTTTNERNQNVYLKRIAFMESVPIFQDVSKPYIRNITYYFDSKDYQREQFVYKEGDIVKNYIYIVWEGEFTISKKINITASRNMTIVEKTGHVIDISPNKHSSLSHNLTKSFELRKVGKMQVLGLEEIIQHNDYNQQKQKQLKKNEKFEETNEELQMFRRKYSV